jgi:L-rhamnose mutarotase
MCEGFGVIVTKDGRYLWIEPDSNGNVSHSDILRRAGIKDIVESGDMFTRPFVRVEIPTWKIGSFRFDEQNTLPGWVDEDAVKTRCNKLLKRVAPACAECEKVRTLACAEYQKVRTLAWAEYQKVKDTAWDEYENVRDTACAEYQKVRTLACAEYQKVKDTAWAEMIETLSKIEGYLSE